MNNPSVAIFAKRIRNNGESGIYSPGEVVALAYGLAVAMYGAESVGELEDYLRKDPGYWTLERCKASALSYTKRLAWKAGCRAAYSAAHKAGWLDICCAHMAEGCKPNGYWSLERCKESAAGYPTRRAWAAGCSSAYSAAYKAGWLGICCAHMTEGYKPKGYWTLERCKESAAGYPTRSAWRFGCSAAYTIAHKAGWLGICCAHMTEVYKPKGYWTLERCKESAAGYPTRYAWKVGCESAYSAAYKAGWLDICCAHMVEVQKPSGYWTLERCKESAAGYPTRSAWQIGCSAAYAVAHRNGWLDICCAHMPPARGKKA